MASAWGGTGGIRNCRFVIVACIPPGATPTCARPPAPVRAPLFVAHIRAATGTPTQETNCHPFRLGRWLFVHNGLIRDFPLVRRDLMMAVAPHLFRWIEGSTDPR